MKRRFTISEEELQAIQSVVDYLWSDEMEDWNSQGQPDDHIFNSLNLLDDLLQKFEK